MVPRLAAALLVLAALFPAASADGDVGGVATVEADVVGADGACAIPVGHGPCVVSRDDGGTLQPGDDRMTLAVIGDRAAIHIGALPGEHQGIELDMAELRVTHPTYGVLNETWKDVNASLPPEVRAWVTFDSRPMKETDSNGEMREDEWGVFLTIHTPAALKKAYAKDITPVAICWEVCTLDWEQDRWLRMNETSIQPFPRGADYRGGTRTAMDWSVVARPCHIYEDDQFTAGLPCVLLPHQAELAADLAAAYDAATPAISYAYRVPDLAVHAGDEPGPKSGGTLGPGASDGHGAADTPAKARPVATPLRADARPDRAALPPPPLTVVDAARSQEDMETADALVPVALNETGLTAWATTAASLLVLLAWALFHRIRRAAALSDETRQRIHRAVLSSPGLRASDIARAAGLNESTVRYHLDILQDAGLVTAIPGGQPRYVPPGHPWAKRPDHGRALGPPLARDLMRRLLADGPETEAELARALGVSLPAVRKHIGRLAEAGLVARCPVNGHRGARALLDLEGQRQTPG